MLHSGDEVRLLDPAMGAVRAVLSLGGGFDVPVRVAIARDAALAVVPDTLRRGGLRILDARTLEEFAGLDIPEPRADGVASCAIGAAGVRPCAGTISVRLVTWDPCGSPRDPPGAGTGLGVCRPAFSPRHLRTARGADRGTRTPERVNGSVARRCPRIDVAPRSPRLRHDHAASSPEGDGE